MSYTLKPECHLCELRPVFYFPLRHLHPKRECHLCELRYSTFPYATFTPNVSVICVKKVFYFPLRLLSSLPKCSYDFQKVFLLYLLFLFFSSFFLFLFFLFLRLLPFHPHNYLTFSALILHSFLTSLSIPTSSLRLKMFFFSFINFCQNFSRFVSQVNLIIAVQIPSRVCLNKTKG